MRLQNGGIISSLEFIEILEKATVLKLDSEKVKNFHFDSQAGFSEEKIYLKTMALKW